MHPCSYETMAKGQLYFFHCMEHKVWLAKHRGFSSDGFALEQQSLSYRKEGKELSCWECMVHSSSVHVNASVSKKAAICMLGRESSPRTVLAGTLILGFQPPEL